MNFTIQPKKIVVSGNTLLMKPLSRKAMNNYRDASKAAGEDLDAQERLGMDLIRANVTFEDGTPLDVDEVPPSDLAAILQKMMGVGEVKGVADFTGTP